MKTIALLAAAAALYSAPVLAQVAPPNIPGARVSGSNLPTTDQTWLQGDVQYFYTAHNKSVTWRSPKGTPGKPVRVTYNPENMTFKMKFGFVAGKERGCATAWHGANRMLFGPAGTEHCP